MALPTDNRLLSSRLLPGRPLRGIVLDQLAHRSSSSQQSPLSLEYGQTRHASTAAAVTPLLPFCLATRSRSRNCLSRPGLHPPIIPGARGGASVMTTTIWEKTEPVQEPVGEWI